MDSCNIWNEKWECITLNSKSKLWNLLTGWMWEYGLKNVFFNNKTEMDKCMQFEKEWSSWLVESVFLWIDEWDL